MSESSATPAPERIVPCPQCGGESVWSPRNAYRPFCSERCKMIDLGAWASESYRVPVETPVDPTDLASDSAAGFTSGRE